MGASAGTTNGRVRRSASEWRELVSRFTGSERSGAAFCRAEGISRSTFDLWRRKLASEKPASPKRAQEFVELAAVPAQLGSWLVEVELPDGTIARMRG